jgi:hypothetical protein
MRPAPDRSTSRLLHPWRSASTFVSARDHRDVRQVEAAGSDQADAILEATYDPTGSNSRPTLLLEKESYIRSETRGHRDPEVLEFRIHSAGSGDR